MTGDSNVEAICQAANEIKSNIDFQWNDAVGDAIIKKIEEYCSKAVKDCQYATSKLRNDLNCTNDLEMLEKIEKELKGVNI